MCSEQAGNGPAFVLAFSQRSENLATETQTYHERDYSRKSCWKYAPYKRKAMLKLCSLLFLSQCHGRGIILENFAENMLHTSGKQCWSCARCCFYHNVMGGGLSSKILLKICSTQAGSNAEVVLVFEGGDYCWKYSPNKLTWREETTRTNGLSIDPVYEEAPLFNRTECKPPKPEDKFEFKPQPQIVLNSNPYRRASKLWPPYAGIDLNESEISWKSALFLVKVVLDFAQNI